MKYKTIAFSSISKRKQFQNILHTANTLCSGTVAITDACFLQAASKMYNIFQETCRSWGPGPFIYMTGQATSVFFVKSIYLLTSLYSFNDMNQKAHMNLPENLFGPSCFLNEG